MESHRDFFKKTNFNGPIGRQRRPDVTIRDIHLLHPNSVYQSLMDYMDWINKLNISPMAKRLTRLRGRDFKLAVQKILA